jgi:uncharacterized membrane protein
LRVTAAILRLPRLPRVPVFAPAAFVVAVLFLAGAIHICAILLIPTFARTDGWSRLAAFAGEDRFVEIPVAGGGSAPGVAGLDPLFVNGACRVQLSENPVALTVRARDRFWSLALYDRNGTIVFSLNDRTAVEGRLDMVVANAAQNARIKAAMRAGLQQSILVEAPSNDLIALLRLFAPTASAQAEARSILAEAECVPEEVAPAAASG